MIEMFDMWDLEFMQDWIICGMVGCDFVYWFFECILQIGEEVLCIEDWIVYYFIQLGCVMVDGVIFIVCVGEVVGIVGFMGVGCMELVMSVFGCIYGCGV